MNFDSIISHLAAADRELNEVDPIHLPLRESQLFGRAQFKISDALNAMQLFAEITEASERDELKMPVDNGPKDDE